MSDDKTVVVKEKRTAMQVAARQIDELALAASAAFEAGSSGLEQELVVAQSIVDLTRLITDEMMKPIMALMNTDLGFRTDRDPTQKNSEGNYPTPYPVEVVKKIFIESRLRGFHAMGNEFNIIAGRFYGAKNGFERKVREMTKGTCQVSIDPPVINGELAKVKARATWTLNGKRDDIGVRPEDPCEFMVKINRFMGPDGATGKAERKLYKRIYTRLTGQNVPDADLSEGSIEVGGTVTEDGGKAPKAAKFGKAAKAEAQQTSTASSTATAAEPAEPEPGQEPAATVPQPSAGPEKCDERDKLVEILMVQAKVSWEDFQGWLVTTGHMPNADTLTSMDELPVELCKELVANTKSLTRVITLYGKK